LKITNSLIKQAAEQRGWAVDVLSEDAGLLRLTLSNGKKLLIRSSLSPFTPATSVASADDKLTTYILAQEIGVPVAETHNITDVSQALKLLDRYHEIVIKPGREAHGNGVSTQLKNAEQVEIAYQVAAAYKSGVLVQPFLKGDDIRILFIGGQLAAAAIRRPASIIGDGHHTIREIISTENESGMRAPNYQKSLNLIDTAAAERFLGETIDTVTEVGRVYTVVGPANMGSGGTSEDVTDNISPRLIEDGAKMLQSIGLETGAADFIVQGETHNLLEINSNPSFGLHVFPSMGKSQDVAALYLDWLAKKAG
jgi:D-alanine-D-alanine ligase-like ATP-grasp enzyme